MKIETKFDIGQEVWVLFGNHNSCALAKEKVSQIQIQCIGEEIDIGYVLGKMWCVFGEYQLFATKSEAEQALKRLEEK